MNRKDLIIQKLRILKTKLEARRERFSRWEQELDKSKRYTEDIMKKSNMYFAKSKRLEGRIDYIDDRIREMSYKSEKNYWIEELENIIKSIKKIGA